MRGETRIVISHRSRSSVGSSCESKCWRIVGEDGFVDVVSKLGKNRGLVNHSSELATSPTVEYANIINGLGFPGRCTILMHRIGRRILLSRAESHATATRTHRVNEP